MIAKPWDYLIVTSANKDQARAYEIQLRVREKLGRHRRAAPQELDEVIGEPDREAVHDLFQGVTIPRHPLPHQLLELFEGARFDHGV